ncbi:MAG: hypothetical protein AAF960_03265 [Bacteroidota bacterium]
MSVLLAEQPDAFVVCETPPDWVQVRLDKGMPTSKELTPEEKQAKAELRQKAFSKRLAQMMAGLIELENWLHDTLRQGLAVLEQQSYSYWKDISARMYDAKLGAIGKRLQAIPLLIGAGDKWPNQVLAELTSFYLLIRGLRKMEELPLNIQQDLLTVAGVTTRKDDLFQYGQTVKDTWMVLGQTEGVEDKLNFRRTWLLGHETKRYALVLDYAFGNAAYPAHYVLGSVFVGKVVFYPSNSPLRVAVKEKLVLDRHVKRIVGFPSFAEYLDFYAQNLAANPWQLAFPCSIESVRPFYEKGQLILIDQEQQLIPTLVEETNLWKIVAISGGKPIHVFGEWTGEQLLPRSISIDNRYTSL